MPLSVFILMEYGEWREGNIMRMLDIINGLHKPITFVKIQVWV